MNVRKIKWLTILVVHEFPEDLNQEYLERIIDQEVLVAGINSKNAFLLVFKSFTVKEGFGFQTRIKELIAGPKGGYVLQEISSMEFDFHEERSWVKLLKWIAKYYMAERICLNTISHGAGFGIYSGTNVGEEVVFGKVTAIPAQLINSIEDRGKYRLDTTIVKDHYIVRTDDKQSSCRSLQMLWISELSNSIKAAYGKRKLDILVFNNCFMQTYENAWMLTENVKFLLAAETQFFSYGFNYLAFLNRVNKNPYIRPDQLIKTFIPDFKKKWKQSGLGNEKRVCLSIIDLVELSKLNFTFNRIASELESLDQNNINKIINVRKLRIRSMTTYPSGLGSKIVMTADLIHVLSTISKELKSELKLKELSDKFRNSFLKQVRKAFYQGSILKEHDESGSLDKYGARGISIFIPYDLNGLPRTEAMMCAYFGRTSDSEALPVEIPLMRFRKKTKWDDFINKIIIHLT